MKIRIDSDGSRTRVTDSETRAELRGITGLRLVQDAGEVTRVELHLEALAVSTGDLEARVVVTDPTTGAPREAAAILWTDGTESRLATPEPRSEEVGPGTGGVEPGGELVCRVGRVAAPRGIRFDPNGKFSLLPEDQIAGLVAAKLRGGRSDESRFVSDSGRFSSRSEPTRRPAEDQLDTLPVPVGYTGPTRVRLSRDPTGFYELTDGCWERRRADPTEIRSEASAVPLSPPPAEVQRPLDAAAAAARDGSLDAALFGTTRPVGAVWHDPAPLVVVSQPHPDDTAEPRVVPILPCPDRYDGPAVRLSGTDGIYDCVAGRWVRRDAAAGAAPTSLVDRVVVDDPYSLEPDPRSAEPRPADPASSAALATWFQSRFGRPIPPSLLVDCWIVDRNPTPPNLTYQARLTPDEIRLGFHTSSDGTVYRVTVEPDGVHLVTVERVAPLEESAAARRTAAQEPS